MKAVISVTGVIRGMVFCWQSCGSQLCSLSHSLMQTLFDSKLYRVLTLAVFFNFLHSI